MSTLEEEQEEEEQNKKAGLQKTLEDAAEAQCVLDFFRNYRGTDPEILNAKEDFQKAWWQSIADSIKDIRFTRRNGERFNLDF